MMCVSCSSTLVWDRCTHGVARWLHSFSYPPLFIDNLDRSLPGSRCAFGAKDDTEMQWEWDTHMLAICSQEMGEVWTFFSPSCQSSESTTLAFLFWLLNCYYHRVGIQWTLAVIFTVLSWLCSSERGSTQLSELKIGVFLLNNSILLSIGRSR